MKNKSRELQTALDAAKAGAECALGYYGKEVDAHEKADKTIITIADKKVEEIIKSHILSKFPDAQFIAEESGGRSNNKEFWTIDPIDGTRYYARGIPFWAILISYCKEGEVQVGVSYMPLLNELAYAERGKGAYINDKIISVSSIAEKDKALVLLGVPRHFPDKKVLVTFVESFPAVRCYGTPYEFHLVASGKCEAVIDAYGKIWDLAPFKVIIEEAGGKISQFNNRPWDFNAQGGVMSNGILHDDIIAILNQK